MLDVVTIGDSVVDIVIPVPHFPTGNEETVVSKGMTRHLGGSSNFLIMSSRLGMKTGVIDLIGDDDLGKFYKSNLDEERVDTSNLIIKNGKKTAHCICMVDDQGQHSYISFPGITSKLTQNDINPNYIKSSKNLYLSGYSLASSPI